MRKSKVFLQRVVMLIFALFVESSFAWGYGSAKVNSIWVDQNVTKNGERGVMVHADLSVYGVKGNRIKATAYFYDNKKENLLGGVDRYRTTSGQVCSSKTANVNYDRSHWDDFEIFIPYRALIISANGTYYVSVVIKDLNQNVRLTKEKKYESFICSKKSKNTDTGREREKSVQSKTWREDIGYGMFAIIKRTSSGAQMRTLYRFCPSCRGTAVCKPCGGLGACSICMGRGYTVTPGYGQVLICSLCNQSGKCRTCNGTGRCFCARSEYPGYVIGSSSVTDPFGNIVASSKADYSDHPTVSKGTSSSGDHEYMELIHFDVPNYTSGDNSRWCEKCKEWGTAHRHERKRIY